MFVQYFFFLSYTMIFMLFKMCCSILSLTLLSVRVYICEVLFVFFLPLVLLFASLLILILSALDIFLIFQK